MKINSPRALIDSRKKKNRYGTGTLPVLLRHKNVAKCDNNVILYIQPEMTNISSPCYFREMSRRGS